MYNNFIKTISLIETELNEEIWNTKEYIPIFIRILGINYFQNYKSKQELNSEIRTLRKNLENKL